MSPIRSIGAGHSSGTEALYARDPDRLWRGEKFGETALVDGGAFSPVSLDRAKSPNTRLFRQLFRESTRFETAWRSGATVLKVK